MAIAVLGSIGAVSMWLTDSLRLRRHARTRADGLPNQLTTRLLERGGCTVMSGYTEEAIVNQGVLNPGIAFLQKPFSSELLGRKIREVPGGGVPARAA